MIRLNILGGLDLLNSEGRVIRSVIAQPKRTALLAYLATWPAGRFHRRDTLLGLFWPQSDQAHARDSLRQAVRYLRRSLGGAAIVGRGDEELGIDPSVLRCDVVEFEEAIEAGDLQSAVDLYRGDLLPGFFVSDLPDFEQWLDNTRHRLKQSALQAAAALAESREATGDLEAAARYARTALQLGPDDEPTVRRVIRLFGRIGDRASAMRTFEDFAARLKADLDIEPSDATRFALTEALAEHGFTQEVVPESPEASASTSMGAASVTDEPGQAHKRRTSNSSAPRTLGLARSLTKWRLAAMMLALVVAIGVVRRIGSRDEASAIARVSVRPFRNRSGQKSLDELASWATESVLNGLSRMSSESVEVLREDSSGDGPPPPPAGMHTANGEGLEGVTVAGSLYRFHDSIQFQVQLLDVDGYASTPTVRPVAGRLVDEHALMGALRERVTGAVAAHLDPWVRALAPEGGTPPSWTSFVAWADGMKRFGQSDYTASIQSLSAAASDDTSFVTPIIWEGSAYGNLGEFAQEDSLLHIAEARRSVLPPFDRCLLDLLEADVRGDLTGQYHAASRMVELAPTNELALYLAGLAARESNHLRESVRLLGRMDVAGSAVDWDDFGTKITQSYHMLGDYSAELAEADAAAARHPAFLRPRSNKIRALAALARTGDALTEVDRVLDMQVEGGLTPGNVARDAADELRAHGHPVEAEQVLRRVVDWYAHRSRQEQAVYSTRFDHASVLYDLGRWSEAEAAFRALWSEDPSCVDCLGYVGVSVARQGRADEARAISHSLLNLSLPYLRGSNTVWMASIAAVSGDPQEAVALLRQSLSEGRTYGVWIHRDPALLALRSDPAFQKLLESAD